MDHGDSRLVYAVLIKRKAWKQKKFKRELFNK